MPLEAPISRWQEPVQDPWIDYNGHLNVAYYALIFDNAMDVFYRLCGLGELYKKPLASPHLRSNATSDISVKAASATRSG